MVYPRRHQRGQTIAGYAERSRASLAAADAWNAITGWWLLGRRSRRRASRSTL